jgi:hypothetical protein
MLLAVMIAAALVLYGAIRFPASVANGGATAFLLSGTGLLTYALAAAWVHRPSSAGVYIALRLGTVVGCCIAAFAVTYHFVEISISLPPLAGAVLGGGMWGVMFLGFGIACSATFMRGYPLPLCILSSVWSAMVSTVVLVACALTIAFVFMPHMQQVLSAAYTASGMTDPRSFVIRHEVGNASLHLLIAPVIALVVGGLSTCACSLLRSVPRHTAIALGSGSLLVFAAGIASIQFATSQPRAQRPPFIMFGLGSLAVMLASAHPLVAAISRSRRRDKVTPTAPNQGKAKPNRCSENRPNKDGRPFPQDVESRPRRLNLAREPVADDGFDQAQHEGHHR